MKIKVELFGVCREFSNQDHIDINFNDKISVQELRKKILDVANDKFPENKNYHEMVKKSAFCYNDEIVSDELTFDTSQTVSIIPPIGGG